MLKGRHQVVLVAVLMATMAFCYLDRTVIGVLGESLKRDLHLSDTQLGLASGAAFALVYSLAAIPLAGISDRGYHKRVILYSIVAWSTLSTLAGLVTNFWQLLLTRIGVAVGEAGVMPASQALIALQVDRRYRSVALAVLVMGCAVGSATAPMLGGWLHGQVGWRGAFIVIGPLALIMAPLAMMVIRQPVVAQASRERESMSIIEAIRTMVSIPGYALFWIGAGLAFTGPQSNLVFAANFFIRDIGANVPTVGAYLGLAFGLGATAGILGGGILHGYLVKRSIAAGLLYPSAMSLFAALVAIACWLSGSFNVSMTCFTVAFFCSSFFGIPCYATALLLAPDHMKSTATAIFNASQMLVGGFVGPLFTGIMSDALQPSLGSHAIGWALVATAGLQILGSVMLLVIAPRLKPLTGSRMEPAGVPASAAVSTQ